ncbi:Serine carboxypeptidase-like 42 [Trifolium repens]|nr:Serine carboxypeptidase-like 42 [Trifolium repens]
MKKCWFVGVLIVLSFLGTQIGVEGYPIEDLVVRLPGQPKVEFKQYAGYVDVDVKHGRSLFYYFVEADHDPHKKPLTLWLNGGPGCSSIGGESWNRASNLLFVESPAGVGWSYSNTTSDYNTGDASTANDMLLFFLKWYEKFPSYRSRKLFLTGESYAGHYIPQLANAILDYNAHSTNFKFNLKIGNPLLNLDRDAQATYEYFWSHGMISDEIDLTIKNVCDFDDYTDFGSHNVSKSCDKALNETAKIVSEYINNYDVILDVCYPAIAEQQIILRKMATKISLSVDVCMEFEREFYLNLPEVQKALHANRTNLPYAWSMCSNNTLNYSEPDIKINILPILKRIVQNHIPVLVYS